MYQRILVPIDGSPTSDKGLDEAIKLSKLTGASLRLIHVLDPLTFATGFEPYAVYAGDLIPRMEEVGNQVLQQGKERAQAAGVKADSLLFDGLAARVSETVIQQAKDWGADLIVIGTHGRRGVGRFVMGSDAEQIVRLAPVPVLLVRAPEAKAQTDTAVKV